MVKKRMFIVVAILAFIVILGGTAYAWFNYQKEGVNQTIIAARPTLHLKSTVKILSGTGTEYDSYVVGL